MFVPHESNTWNINGLRAVRVMDRTGPTIRMAFCEATYEEEG